MLRVLQGHWLVAATLLLAASGALPLKFWTQAGTTRRYLYHFENSKFDKPLVEVAFQDDGKGVYRFRSKEVEGITESPFQISASTLTSFRNLFSSLAYLEDGKTYQSPKYDYAHLGTVTIAVIDSGGERKAVFNYTQNATMTKLVALFRDLATQEQTYFDLELAMRHYPLDTPKQLSSLDSNLKAKRIPDPGRFIPLLQEIVTSEEMLLIAKRQAQKLLQEMKKSGLGS